MKQGHRPNTRRNIRSQASIYQHFCDTYGLQEMPADEWQYIRYAVYTAERVTTHGTVANYIGGVRNLHKLAGFQVPHPDDAKNLNLTMQGIKSSLAKPVKQASPMTPQILLEIYEMVNFSNQFEVCCFAATLTGFYLTIRVSNIVPTSTKKFNPQEQFTRWHVGLDFPHVAVFLVEWSKNNQNKGRKMWIPVSPAPDSRICLIQTLQMYFRMVPVGDDEPCFCYRNEKGTLKALTYGQLNTQIQSWVKRTGRTGSFSTHCLRRGGCNHGVKSGLAPEYIRKIGDWASDCFLKYIDVDLDMRCAAAVQFNK